MKTMNDQIIILVFLLVAAGITLFLYVWKAKKEIEYKKDERWQLLQNKANNAANHSNSILIVIVAIGSIVSLFYDIQLSFTFNRVLIYAMLFVGLRNGIELFALRYFDKRL
jgi:formate hydrogenlyase subunit 3/multisubunit Na+/H+ antiporter MnhD subunit